jgi:hypothetical protein
MVQVNAWVVMCSVLVCVGAAGCKKGELKTDSPGAVATIWGKLVCDRRGDLMNIQVELIKKQQENAALHSQITAGTAKESNPLPKLEGVLQYVREHRKALNACEVSVGELRPLDGDTKSGRYAVDVSVLFEQLVWREGQGEKQARSLVLPIEVAEQGGQWYVTSEPGVVVADAQLGLMVE